MIDKLLIVEIVEKYLTDSNQYLIEVTVSGDNVINVTIDSETSVSLDHCIGVNKFIENSLDREVEDYELNVMSAGLGSPFKIRRQYEKYKGESIEITGRDGRRRKVMLLEVEDNSITVEEERSVKQDGSKKKVIIKEKMEIPFDQIKIAKAIIDF